MNSGNFKKFENQLKKFDTAKTEICNSVNEWVRNTYNERSLDL